MPSHGTHTCPCGARLWTRAELFATGGEIDAYVAEAYLTETDGYCNDEDEVVPLGYAAEVIRRRGQPCPHGASCDPRFGCPACVVPLDFPLPARKAGE